MSGETEANVSGWTVDTLHSSMLRLLDERDRRYMQRFFDAEQAVQAALVASDKLIAAALASAEKAVAKNETATEARFASVNEFRQSLDDVTRRLELALKDSLSVAEFQRYVERLDKDEAASRRARATLTAGVASAVFAAAVSIILNFAH